MIRLYWKLFPNQNDIKKWNKERCASVVTVQLLRLLLSYAIFVFLVVSAHKTSCPTASRLCIVVDVKTEPNLSSSDGSSYECVQWFLQTIRANGPIITQQMINAFPFFVCLCQCDSIQLKNEQISLSRTANQESLSNWLRRKPEKQKDNSNELVLMRNTHLDLFWYIHTSLANRTY